ncbi:MAG: hypothetical protein IKP60_09830 [Treponema sp.]|nr:hypothetical protein [Treponema sp.]
MIFKCKNCGAALEYSPELEKMVCSYCGNSFTVEEISTREPKPEPEQTETTTNESDSPQGDSNVITNQTLLKRKTGNTVITNQTPLKEKQEHGNIWNGRGHATITMQIIRCTACGAELAINGTETSSFCSYCGQATLVQDRMDEYLKPDCIIPFKIGRDNAEKTIRDKMAHGFFIPKEIRNFEVEKIRGIYVPFWLFDMDYHDKQVYKYKRSSGQNNETRFEYFEGKTNFKNLTLDASLNLDDDSSTRLEPYRLGQLKDFDMAYLSGFYSDRFDMGIDDITPNAIEKAKKIFNQEALRKTKHKGELIESHPLYKVTDTKYALLPAWFLTFRYKNKPYTILVNGQTGKMVGAFPVSKPKTIALFSLFGIAFTAPALFLCIKAARGILGDGFSKGAIGYIFMISFLIIAVALLGFSKYRAFKKSRKLTAAEQINKYTEERQDK